MRREGEEEITKKIKPSAAWHSPPAKRAKTSAGSGARRYYTRVQGQCWGPFSTTRVASREGQRKCGSYSKSGPA